MKLTKLLGAVILAVSVTAAAALPVSASEYTVDTNIAALTAAGFTVGSYVTEKDGEISLPVAGTSVQQTADHTKAISFKPTYSGTLNIKLSVERGGRAGIIPHTTGKDTDCLGNFTANGGDSIANGRSGTAYLLLTAGETYYIASKDKPATINSITYTYTGRDQTIAVDPITVGDDTTSAGIKFTRSDTNNVWDYSVYEQVKNFVGKVAFDVTMSDVPTDVTVTGETYAN